jgi:hypothetical protein
MEHLKFAGNSAEPRFSTRPACALAVLWQRVPDTMWSLEALVEETQPIGASNRGPHASGRGGGMGDRRRIVVAHHPS